MAQEQVLGQKWTNCTEDIPTTDPELFLANLDISDPEHPFLYRPEAPKGKAEAVRSIPVPGDSPSSPMGESLHSDSAAHLSRRSSPPSPSSSAVSLMDGSWTLDLQTAIMNVSSQWSFEEIEHSDARGGTVEASESREQVEMVA